ncbi:centromere-associated protein E isoform X2 [Artibeus jamaicensis]|uniref:centromere-associated protein E isoform X2 n=1 Tax=Artibeus jamaicensis TaxID=9417 RepID=UPI00235B2C5A|nr:centromere-associated protein E isoform X2 [Artibeus jamaicensis]
MAEEGAVAVCVRVRPLNSREEALGDATQVYWKTGNNTVYQVDGSKSFSFDRVFHSNETTKNVYEEIAVPIIDSAIQGYNGTIFAYGQTASGKTYTMMGSEDYLGVIPRAIHDIFQKIEKFPDREFLLRVSYMEIYNETITDLLCDTRKMKPLIIREDFNRNVYVSDLTEEVVYTSEMALKWITKGEKNRHYGITKMNQRSSRSHTIFRMILESREKGEPSNCEGSVKVSHLNLVDLAGSERAAQTGAEGMRLKEGCNINRSLFILGQVIKKLSDGQVGGFINYRDSKLTRILQNSLGGNAKTRIICTITPVSFDETLSTLQFASTAKYMKNTPYVNEVSSDEALLKRYRKEIMDLKKQLEEVSLETRAQAMEKDQLAQLLEEKDLLQKVQIEKIQNLTRMLVTSSSLTSRQELKAKIKRRVTWCPGKINKMKDSNYINEFNIPTNTPKNLKTSITLVGEIDESICSEADVFSNTLDIVTDVEWNPATKLLSQENLESELNSLRADYDNLVLDYERLRKENEEMELKLKEKNDLDEFEALERKAEKDQEMQLIHEISNLKNLVKHAEVYNQDLENELNSKVDLLKEKEDQIKKLQEYIDSQKSESMKMDLSYSLEDTEDLKQKKQTLLDAETVALDAKRESAFLRSENLELKEKMKELESICKQMENDNQLHQSRLEAKKKIQIDLEKELQSSFNEITRLTSLIDGKVPKDLLCNLELERKVTDLQKELKKEVEVNEALHKKVNLLSELTSLPSEVEMLRKKVNDKSEELYLMTSEKDKLFSELTHKESRIQDLLEEITKTKGDLASTQLNYKKMDQEFQDFKNCHIEFEQKYNMALEENARINQEIENLTKHRTQELQRSQELNEVEELKEQLASRDSSLQTVEREKTLITEKLQQTLEEVRALTLERDAFRQVQESLQIERDQLRSDIEDTVHMNIDTQEQLRNALESLKQHQETINTLKMKISEESSKNSHIEENTEKTKDEFQEEIQEAQDIQEQTFNEKEKTNETKKIISEMEQLKEQLKTKESALLRLEMEKHELSERLQESHEEMESIAKERDDLQRLQEVLQSKNGQLQENMEEIIAKHLETEEELKVAHRHLAEQEETIDKLRVNLSERETELSSFQKELETTNDESQKKMQELHEKQEQFICLKEEISETQEKMSELAQLKEQLKAKDFSLESMESERLKLIERLKESQEEIKLIIKERDELKRMQETLQMERDQLKEDNKEIVAEAEKIKEELKSTYTVLKEYQETINTRDISEKTDQGANIQRDLENSDNELWGKIQEFQEKEHQILEMKAVNETQEMCEIEYLKKQLDTQKSTLENLEMENVRLTKRLQDNLEEIQSVTKERDDLRSVEETLKVERDQLKENLRETVVRDLEKQEELKIANIYLKEHQETIDELRRIISEKTDEISNMQKDFENKNSALKAQSQELQEKEHQLLKVKNDLRENMYQTEQLKKQLEAQHSLLESTETEKLRLTKQLHENLEEVRCVTEERDSLRRMEGTLRMEGDQLRESLREAEAKIQELKANEHQFLKLKEEVSETQKKVSEMEELKKQIKAQSLTLDKIEMENLNLAQKFHENLEEMKSIMKERDNLRRVEESLKLERDQLKADLQETIARDLETQQELKIARMHLKEHQETIDKFKETVSEKTTQISNMKKDLNKSEDDLQKKIQELQKKELQLLKMKEVINKTHKKMNEMERVKKQFEAQILSVQNVEMDNSYMTKKLHESLEEIRIVAKERDELRKIKESLKMERDQFRETLRKTIARAQQNDREVVKYEKKLLCDGKQYPTESLRKKCFRIKELLKKYSEMDNQYEFLNRLSVELEKEIETQKELSIKIKATLSLPYPQTKQIHKLLTVNQRCSMEFYRVMKNLKYVLSNVIMIKKEQHESINKFEMVFIDEVEKQNELLVKLQHLPQDYDVPSRELRDLRLSQKVDLHIEEILKDFSESDFHSIKTEFQQVLSNRKEMTQFLEEWLKTHFDTEELKSGIQKENDRVFQVNKFYNNRIIAIVNESTEFEQRSANLAKEWEHDLKSMKEENEKLFKNYQTLEISQTPGALANPTTQDYKNLHVTSRAKQQITDKIEELETSLREAKESAMHKEDKIIKMQKELEMTNDVVAKLQDQVNESNKCLEKSKEMIQVLEDKVALGTKPYKEEIEDLKMKLVKIDLEKMKTAKEFEKEIASTKATVEYQKEVIRVLRENLRRNQQAQDTSMVSEENNDSQPLNKPLTCGGGSGIVQSTKALILKSEYARLKKEISKLKQQNEQLIKQKSKLSSLSNSHLSSEVLKGVACESSPKSPEAAVTASEKRQRTPSHCRERNVQDPVPKESPKSWFFDSRSKSFPSPHPVRYFDNSGLGLCPEEPPAGEENVVPRSGSCQTFPEKDLPECKIQ